MSISVGTTFTRSQNHLQRAQHDGLTLRVTMDASLTDNGRLFEIGCQTFSLTELMDANGSVVGRNPDRTVRVAFEGTVVAFEGTVRDANFEVSPTRVYSLNDINARFIEAEVVATAPTTQEVSLQGGIYFCEVHERRHFFVASVEAQNNRTTGRGVVRRLGLITHNSHVPEPSAPEGATGFAQWPTCRPVGVRQSKFAALFGATPGREVWRNYEVAPHQFPGTARV